MSKSLRSTGVKDVLVYLLSPCTYNKSNLLAVLAIFSDFGHLDLVCETKNKVLFFCAFQGASICILNDTLFQIIYQN